MRTWGSAALPHQPDFGIRGQSPSIHSDSVDFWTTIYLTVIRDALTNIGGTRSGDGSICPDQCPLCRGSDFPAYELKIEEDAFREGLREAEDEGSMPPERSSDPVRGGGEGSDTIRRSAGAGTTLLRRRPSSTSSTTIPGMSRIRRLNQQNVWWRNLLSGCWARCQSRVSEGRIDPHSTVIWRTLAGGCPEAPVSTCAAERDEQGEQLSLITNQQRVLLTTNQKRVLLITNQQA